MRELEIKNMHSNVNDIDLAVLKSVVQRIDQSITTMSEVSTSIGKMLAVHDERINKLDKDTSIINLDIRQIHNRLTDTSNDVFGKLDILEEEITTKIDKHNKIDEIRFEKIETHLNDISKRIDFLEKWKWMILGGSFAIGWVLTKLPGVNLL